MSIQYKDGSFGPVMPIDEATEKFFECLKNNEPVQALHVGTLDELEKRQRIIKESDNLQQQINELRDKVDSLTKNNISSDCIYLPTSDEIKQFI